MHTGTRTLTNPKNLLFTSSACYVVLQHAQSNDGMMEGAMDPGTTVRTSGTNLSITFSLMDKCLENSRERFSVNRFATRKDEWVFAHNCSGSPGVPTRMDGRYLCDSDLLYIDMKQWHRDQRGISIQVGSTSSLASWQAAW